MSEFFTIGEIETRTINKGRNRIKVRVAEAATDHVGGLFIIRPAEFTGQEADAWFRACERCNGCGHYSYNQIDGTICYGCFGSGLGAATTPEAAEALVKTRRATRDRKFRAEVAAAHEQAAKWNEFRDEHADVIAFLADKMDRRGFLGDMAEKVAKCETLSVRMVEVVRDIIERDAAKAIEKEAAGHFGTVGKREQKITAKVVKSIELPDYGFGISWLIIMETAAGQTLKTKTSGAFADVEAGETYTFAGTVKEHGEYKGAPETILSRCALPKAPKTK